MLKDPRVTSLAQILVRHSIRVKRGDVCVLTGNKHGEPLLQAIYEEAVKAGGHVMVNLALEGQAAMLYKHASKAQLGWMPPTKKWIYEKADCLFNVMAETNPSELASVSLDKQTHAEAANRRIKHTMMKRSATGDLRWVLTMFPTHASAAKAGMSFEEYTDFYFKACLATGRDPINAWKRNAKHTLRLSKWIQGKKKVHIEGPGTDITLGIKGRTFVPAVGESNMPDGEFFTGPEEQSVDGVATFNLPASRHGRPITGIRLVFKKGRVVEATAKQNQASLRKALSVDPGAKRLGELGIGTNYSITKYTHQVLLDEKIGGTVHMALGAGYPETGSKNRSAIHWDLITDLRKGGKITVDGKLLQKNGKFVV